MAKTRIIWADLLRSYVCIFVVFVHTSDFLEQSGVNPVFKLLYLMSGNVTMFFVISGAFLLPIRDGGNKEFFKRRLMKLLIPFLFYTFAYFIIAYLLGYTDPGFLVFQFKWFWLNRFIGVQWFLFVLIGLYLLMPFLSPWLRRASKRQVEFFLLFWCAAMTLPFLNIKSGTCMYNTSYEQTIFGSFYNYTGFIVLGYYMIRWPFCTWSRLRKLIVTISCAILMFGVMPFFYYYFDSPKANMLPFDDLTITVVGADILMFIAFSSIKSVWRWLDNTARFISLHSYGIYICHPIFYVLVVPYFCPGLVQTWLMFPIVMSMTLLTVWMVASIPVIGRFLR